MVTADRSKSGVIFTDLICVDATGSSQTVCQMPLVGVYQIPPGLPTCFPRGCGPASVGSQADTTISCGPDGFNAPVMSRLNAS